MNRRHIGNTGEDIACKYLQDLGYKIQARNFTIQGGEIDIVASKGDITYFVEVKYRTSEKYGHPLETMTEAKLEAFERAMLTYCEKNSLSEEEVRRLFIAIIQKKGTQEVVLTDF